MTPTDPSRPPKSLWGRVLVLSLFWLLAAAAAFPVLFAAVVTAHELVSPSKVGRAERLACVRTLAKLHDELNRRASTELAANATGKIEAWQTWWTDYGEKLRQQQGVCKGVGHPEVDQLFDALAHVHDELGSNVQRLLELRERARREFAHVSELIAD